MLDGSSYSKLDRLMHRVAFGHRSVQKVLSEMEASAFGQEWQDVSVDRPVFITSLPRAGTTLLLQLLARLPSVATHTYRDMPFVMAPVLWNRLSKSFHADDSEVERAHGDGMMVGVDSPEAFEEILWLAHFPGFFQKGGIALWDEIPDAFIREFNDHMRRIIHLRGQTGHCGAARYVSKNNANIARINALNAAFPDSTILVPLRHPLAQAQSMLRQHKRFAAIHAADKFSMRYMADIGHFEFGLPHRPIKFPGFQQIAESYRPDDLQYWLAYWTAAFRHLAECRKVTFVDYEGFCSDGGNFEALCEFLGLATDRDSIENAKRQIRPQAKADAPESRPENFSDAEAVFDEIRTQCLFSPVGAALPLRK